MSNEKNSSSGRARHTPGPWHSIFDNDIGCMSVVDDARTMPAIYIDQARELDVANARLIAAAPELLAALEKISSLNPSVDSDEGFNEWGEADCFNKAQLIARAAISKAKGE